MSEIKDMNQYERRQAEAMARYQKRINPDFINYVRILAKDWSWQVVGCKVGIPAHQWSKITALYPDLIEMRDRYRMERRRARIVHNQIPDHAQ